MHANCPTMELLANNAIRFITINYDRSLEYLLYQAIMNTYGIAGAAVLAFLPNIQILHLYEQLGQLATTQTPGTRMYTQ
jgi:hypothetical protein